MVLTLALTGVLQETLRRWTSTLADADADHAQAADELARSASLLRCLVRNAPPIVYAPDADGICTLSMGKALQRLGFEEGQMVGTSVWEVRSTPTTTRSSDTCARPTRARR